LPFRLGSGILLDIGELDGCLMSIDQRIQAKRREILRIAAEHGARNVRVFGSSARGEAGPGSDVDFLVAVQPEHSSWFPAGLIVDLQELLNCDVDVVTEEALHWYIHDRVLEEAVPL
jgi:predicted nucleotidyltransferase